MKMYWWISLQENMLIRLLNWLLLKGECALQNAISNTKKNDLSKFKAQCWWAFEHVYNVTWRKKILCCDMLVWLGNRALAQCADLLLRRTLCELYGLTCSALCKMMCLDFVSLRVWQLIFEVKGTFSYRLHEYCVRFVMSNSEHASESLCCDTIK